MPGKLVISCAFALSLASGIAAGAEGFDARLGAANARAEAGDHDAALAAFEALAREFPTRPEPLNNLAAELARRGDLVRSRELLERALRTHPAYATAHDNLRTVYAALASDAYRKALPVTADAPPVPELALIARASPEPSVAAAARPVPIAEPSVTQAAAAAASASTATGPREVANARAHAVFAAVDAWARAWSAKDVAGYLAAYGPGFVPPDGLSRQAWEAQRSERIRAPKQISVSVAQRDLLLDADHEHATIRFMQTYRSDRFNGSSWKTLSMVLQDGRWLIVGERAGR
jgi:tetratricopeptide (TPR) repeat protein